MGGRLASLHAADGELTELQGCSAVQSFLSQRLGTLETQTQQMHNGIALYEPSS